MVFFFLTIGSIQDVDKLLEFARLGVYCQFDLFGTEVSVYQLNPAADMPSDAQRIDRVLKLVDEGYVERVLMSHDIHTKHRLVSVLWIYWALWFSSVFFFSKHYNHVKRWYEVSLHTR